MVVFIAVTLYLPLKHGERELGWVILLVTAWCI